VVTNAKIQKLYHALNKKWFRNRLPKDMVVDFVRMKGAHGVTVFYKVRPLHIMLNLELRICEKIAALTLLHEMVHVEWPKHNHGFRFHRRMKELARRGAFVPYW
jgi:hypothetical protein